jgi:hypothetical protein
MAARREPVEAMALARSLSAVPRSHRQRSRLPRDGWRVSISQFRENGAVKVGDAIAFSETPP